MSGSFTAIVRDKKWTVVRVDSSRQEIEIKTGQFRVLKIITGQLLAGDKYY